MTFSKNENIMFYIIGISQEVLMKKTDVDPLNMYTNGLKGITLAATMLTFSILCQEIKDDWPEYEKVKKTYSSFDKSNRNDLKAKNICSSKTSSLGESFLKEIKAFKQLPEAKDDDLQEMIKSSIEITASIIS